MAVEIDTATDYADLLDKLVTFATANGWTELENTSDKVVLSGEGSGSEEIIVAFQKYSDVGSDSFGWFINGYSGWTSGPLFAEQAGALPNWISGSVPAYPAMPLWNSTIPYWFIVSERRIVVVAKISTTYQMCYAGYFLPYASPGQYPYPLMVGGSQSRTSASNYPRFSDATSAASCFWRGRLKNPGTFFIRENGGTWVSYSNAQQESFAAFWIQNTQEGIFPYNSVFKISITQLTQALDGSAVLTPLQIHNGRKTDVTVGWLGEIDGVFHVSGNSQAAEDVITVDGDDYLVVQDVFRTGVSDYCAVRLT